MKIMIASDIHGSALYCEKLLEAMGIEKPDKLLLLGDILYHGPRNDLPEKYAPKQVIQMLNSVKDSLFCIRGNCDSEVDQMVLEFPILADYCILPIETKKGIRMIYATHGHIYNPTNPPSLGENDILLNGHTHIPSYEELDNFTYMNPGSISIPKENSAHSYLILEEGIASWKSLDGTSFLQKDLSGF